MCLIKINKVNSSKSTKGRAFNKALWPGKKSKINKCRTVEYFASTKKHFFEASIIDSLVIYFLSDLGNLIEDF